MEDYDDDDDVGAAPAPRVRRNGGGGGAGAAAASQARRQRRRRVVEDEDDDGVEGDTDDALQAALRWYDDAKRRDIVPEMQWADPTEEERQAMRAYSNVLLENRAYEAQARRNTVKMRARAAAMRRQLYEWMVEHEEEVVAVPKDALMAINTELVSKGLPPMEPYVRMYRNNRDATIQVELVQEAVNSVTRADIEDAQSAAKKPLTVTQAFFAAVATKVRVAVRTYIQQVKMTSTLPRGTKQQDVPDAPPDVVDWARQAHLNVVAVAHIDAKRKEQLKRQGATLARTQPLVDTFLTKLTAAQGSASQRIVLDGVPYRLVRRVTKVKKRIAFGTIEAALWQGLERAWHLKFTLPTSGGSDGGGGGGDRDKEDGDEEDEPARRKKRPPPPDPLQTLDAVDALLKPKSRELLAASVVAYLSSIPPTITTQIKLYDVPKPRIAAPK